jgi:hypothetical protein
MANEDHGQVLNTDQLTVAVLADGAGVAEAGGMAAQILVPAIADWLASSFQEQYYCDGATVRRRLTQLITRLFRSFAEDHGLDPKELACTLIAVAVDTEGHGIAIHLGDGIILRKRQQDTHIGVVSSPENGLVSNATYLTMNCNMYEHCRFYRFSETGPFQMIAMTDGAAAHLVERRSKEGWVYCAPCSPEPETLLNYLAASDPMDDYSFFVVSSCPNLAM